MSHARAIKNRNYLSMFAHLFYFFFFVLAVLVSPFQSARATSSCSLSPCPVYAHLSANQKGLSKLLSLSSPRILEEASNTARKNVQHYFESDAFKKKLAEIMAQNAFFPDFNAGSAKNLMKHADFQVSDLKVDSLKLSPGSQVKCENLICEMDVNIEDFSMRAKMKGEFHDSGKVIMPETEFSLNRSESLDKKGSIRIKLKMDPTTGQLNDLVSVQNLQMQLDPSFLNLKMNNKTIASGTVEHLRLEKKQTQEIARIWKTMNSMQQNLQKVSDPQERAQLERDLDQLAQNPNQISHESYARLRLQLARFPEFRDRQELAKLDYRAQSLGFADGATLGLVEAMVSGYNQDLRDPQQLLRIQNTSKIAKVQKVEDPIELGLNSAIEDGFNSSEKDLIHEMNEGLKDLQTDFNDLMKRIPSLPALDYTRYSNLEDQYLAEQKRLAQMKVGSPEHKKSLEKLRDLAKELQILENKIENDEIQINASLALRKIERANGLTASMYAKSKAGALCAEAQATDFKSDLSDKSEADLSTELSPEGANAYFESHFANGKMDMCVDGVKEDCSDGRKITAVTPPKVSCSASEGYKVEFNYKVGNAGAISGSAHAEFAVCDDGYPCLKIHGLENGAKNSPQASSSTILLKLFNAGGNVERLIRNFQGRKFMSTTSFQDSVRPSVSYRPKLVSAQKDPKSCNLKMDWQLIEKDSAKIP